MMDESTDAPPNRTRTLVLKVVKRLSLVTLSYLFGRWNWSLLWIYGPVMYLVYHETEKEIKAQRRDIIRALSNEKEVILKYFNELPAWVHFPDVEKAEWINKVVKQLWSMINHYAKDYLEGPLQENLAKSIKGFHFERVKLGSVPLRIGGVKVYDSTSRDEIVMDIDITYAGDCDITFSATGLSGGIKDFQLYGKLRVVMKPVIPAIPFVGGIQAFFINNPDIDFDFIGVAQVLDIPVIRTMVKNTIVSTIGSYVVLPNKYYVKLSDNIDTEAVRTTQPEGVLRVHIVEAQDLMKKDINLIGRDSSDPYAKLFVGSQTYKTKVIDKNVNPKWDEWTEFVVLQAETQILHVSLFDKDQMNKDDSLGDVQISISDLVQSTRTDKWLILNNAKTGKIFLRFWWFTLSDNSSDLEAILQETQALQKPHLHSSILTVYVDSASKIPQQKRSNKPDTEVAIKIGKQTKKTQTVFKDDSPIWEESFSFLVNNPESESMELELIDTKAKQSLGVHTYSLKKLLKYPDMKVTQEPLELLLKGHEHSTKLKCSLRLRVMKRDEDPEDNSQEDPIIDDNANKTSNEEKRQSTSSIQELLPNDDLIESASNSESPSRHETPRGSITTTGAKQIQLTIRYSDLTQKLIIVVHQLENVFVKDNSKIYVKCYLLPEGKDSKRKTAPRTGNNPVFDENLEYVITRVDLDQRIKQIKIMVAIDKVMKNELIGQTIINLDSDLLSNGAQTRWYELSK